MARASMRDVARLARVSIGTVSNVVNNPELVAPATRERVDEVIAELGWVPRRRSVRAAAGSGRTIGLAVMDLSDPLCLDLLGGAQEVLFGKKYLPLIGDAGGNPARQRGIVHMFVQQGVCGMLLTPIGGDVDELAELLRVQLPTVLIGRCTDEAPLCAVEVDDVTGGRLALEHLIAAGHRRVAFLGGPSSQLQVRDLLEGARQAADEAGAELVDHDVAQMSLPAGRQAALELTAGSDPRPTAVFCADDLLAMGLLQGLLEEGLRVPDDVAIVGYGDIELASAAAVPLSSVAHPGAELGRSAANLLLAEIAAEGRPHVHRSVRFSPKLIVRASSTPS